MKPPANYAEWCALLDLMRKAEGDKQELLELARRGTLCWQPGVAQRFTKNLLELVNQRLGLATSRFARDMRTAGGEENAIVRALLQVRREVAFAHALVDLPAIPAPQRQEFIALVDDQARQIQKSLENSAQADHTGQLLSLVRGHRIIQASGYTEVNKDE